MARGVSMVGREAEMAILEERVLDARAGRGGLVLVAGEPGIGKTRLASEVADGARQAGMAVVWGRCREDGGAPPYFPFVQVVQSAMARAGLSPIDQGPGASDLESLVDRHPAAAVPQLDASQRFRLFASVASTLERCARESGLLVIIDDLHRADEG